MSNHYLEKKIFIYNLLVILAAVILIIVSFIAGRYFYFESLVPMVFVGIIIGVIGGVALLCIEYLLKKQGLYEKGLRLEEQVAVKLEKLDIDYEPHIETPYGDLDLLVEKSGKYYGVEAKNWSGVVKFENGVLKVSDWDSTYILTSLLKHCVLARNQKFGETSGKFIKPVLVFGYKTDIHIPQNKIIFNNIEIIIATIKDFDQFIK